MANELLSRNLMRSYLVSEYLYKSSFTSLILIYAILNWRFTKTAYAYFLCLIKISLIYIKQYMDK